ncbi:MAG: hypothetical protein LBT39_07310, partial [Treponema sp.]|nr:hypothetical protein [Treponema sp.]
MAKSEKAVYAPGELDRVRGKLGVTNQDEAKRIAALLGGEVGVERSEEAAAKSRKAPVRKPGGSGGGAGGAAGGSGGSAGGRRRPGRHVETATDEEEVEALKKAAIRRPSDPADDPLIPVKASYFERIRMDRFCALPEFKIKSAGQAFLAIFALFGESPDLANPAFINKKLNIYYKKIEMLVTSVRTLFPRNNSKRNEKLRRVGPVSYNILDMLRFWNLEQIAADIARVQARPRNVKISELSEILKAIYRPLFILEQMDTDVHIKGAFKLLYKILYLENPMDAKEKFQGLIRDALTSFHDVRRDLHYYLYPLLMKLLSDRYLSYETFFSARRNRFMDFIGASEADRMNPAGMAAELGTCTELVLDDNMGDEKEDEEAEQPAEPRDEDPNDPEVIARKEKEVAQEKEHKAMLQGVACLEALFPKAGWERLSSFPDIYPYFRDIYNLKKGYELIAPADPLLQAVVIMRILEDLFLGLRNTGFGTILNNQAGPVQIDEAINSIIGDWHNFIDDALEKEYLPRLTEYCRILEQSADSRTSNYAKRLFCELHWIKRLFFFPYYKFDMLFPPPFQKKDIVPAYPSIRSLRRYLTLVAAGIEQANKSGGAEKMVPCDGIDNPWEPYNFAISNPVSTRLDALIAPKRRNNATLIFFSLAFATVLDHLVNDESSWAYRERIGTPFRNVNGMPQFGVDTKID